MGLSVTDDSTLQLYFMTIKGILSDSTNERFKYWLTCYITRIDWGDVACQPVLKPCYDTVTLFYEVI